MAWARLDDNANGAAKLIALSDGAYRLYVAGLVYCQRNLTNGAIPRHAVATFGVRAKHLERLIAEELCRAVVPGKGPLWHETDAGWEVHDYLDWNDDRASVLAERSRAAQRKAAWRGRSSATSLPREDRADAAPPRTRDATQDRTRDATRDETRDETQTSGGDGTEDPRSDRPPDGTRDGPRDGSGDGRRSGSVPERVRNGRSTSTTTDDLDRGRRDRSQDQEQPAWA